MLGNVSQVGKYKRCLNQTAVQRLLVIEGMRVFEWKEYQYPNNNDINNRNNKNAYIIKSFRKTDCSQAHLDSVSLSAVCDSLLPCYSSLLGLHRTPNAKREAFIFGEQTVSEYDTLRVSLCLAARHTRRKEKRHSVRHCRAEAGICQGLVWTL